MIDSRACFASMEIEGRGEDGMYNGSDGSTGIYRRKRDVLLVLLGRLF